MKKQEYTAAECIEAAKNSRGFVTTIARHLGCSRSHVYRLREKFATFAQALEDERESLKDFAEGKLLEQIHAGSIPAIIFFLKTQAQGRGYIERQQFDIGSDDKFEKLMKELRE